MPTVIIPTTITPRPEHHEVTAAALLAEYFNLDVVFLPRAYYPTPDFKIGTLDWELKSPKGSGEHTIQHNLRSALKKSAYIVFDTRRMKMNVFKARRELQRQFLLTPEIKRLILITKTGKVVELTRSK